MVCMRKNRKLAKILFIEDSKNEFLLTKMLLERENIVTDLELARNAKEAMDYLANNPKPDLIFLDKRLTLIDKNSILNQLKIDRKFKNIPVILIFGIENMPEHINPRACENGVVACIDKPVNYDKLLFITKQIKFLALHYEENKIYLHRIT